MIAKVGHSTSVKATIDYLEHNAERVDWKASQHLASDEKSFVIDQMETTAKMSRTDQPIYHYSISWDKSDRPTQSQMEAVARQTLSDLGMEGHQALIVAHSDHDYPHVHVMANRVHPETGRAWNRRMDYEKLEQSLRPLERSYGWKEVPGHHLQLEGQQEPAYGQSLNRLEVARVKNGQLPFFAQVQEVAEYDFRNAGSWRDLHQRLAEYGLTIQRGSRGTGGKITDGHRYANLSKIHRDFSMNRLVGRFGPFQSLSQLQRQGPLTDKQKTFLHFERSVRFDQPTRHALRKQMHQMISGLVTAKRVHRTLNRLLKVTSPQNPAFKITKAISKTVINNLQPKQKSQTHERGR